ncbi:unnamed protein product [Moneuplotes crassus]|uniref:Ubiquitin-like domain-containing protein n=1 Tax=Euplotes crassus TaxID=5936 RepID=A0AAD1Y400_EUPCR|nr:unnamed protein product [Moneuplotes crassus]
MSTDICVNIVDETGEMAHLKINTADSIAKLKEEICKVRGWEMDNLRVGFKGKELGPTKDLETIEKVNIQEDSTIYCSTQLDGAGFWSWLGISIVIPLVMNIFN